jgi:signal peptidase I
MKNNKTPEKIKRNKKISWLIFGILLFIRFFFFEHFMVPSSSMTPTLLTGDIIFIKKFSYAWSRLSVPFGGYLPFAKKGIHLGNPQRGDIVVLTMSREPSQYYAKRIVAIENDYVQMINGILHINGKPCKMEFLGKFTFKNDANMNETGDKYRVTMPFPPYKSYTVFRNQPFGLGYVDNTLEFMVPKGHVWVQGDFNTGSSDSFNTHFMGPIPVNELVGKPFFVLYGSNARLPSEPILIKWIFQLPWRVLSAIRHTNFERICVKLN